MELNEKDLLEIHRFKNGLMTDSEKKGMEERMQNDPSFKKELTQFTGMLSALETFRQVQSAQYLRDLESTLPEIRKPLKKIKLWQIAATITLFIAIAFGINKYISKKEKADKKPNQTIAAVFEPYPTLGFKKSETIEDKKHEALLNYVNNDFEKAIPQLENVFNESHDSLILFYQAISHLAIGEETKALPLFEKLKDEPNVPHDASQFYLALSYLALGQRDKAMLLLNKLAATEGRYKEKALRLKE